MTKANSDNNSPAGSAPRIADDFAAIRNSLLSRRADVAPAATVSTPDPLIAHCDEWHTALAERTAAYTRFGIAEEAASDARKRNDPGLSRFEAAEEEADEAKQAVHDRCHDLLDQVIATKPRTIEGLFAKLHLMGTEVRAAHLPGREPDDIYERTYLRLADDVTLLTGGAT